MIVDDIKRFRTVSNCGVCADNVEMLAVNNEVSGLHDAHLHTAHNSVEIENSRMVCCICCGKSFHPNEVEEYADNGLAAICPYCGVDAIIGDASGIELKDELIKQLHNYYF